MVAEVIYISYPSFRGVPRPGRRPYGVIRMFTDDGRGRPWLEVNAGDIPVVNRGNVRSLTRTIQKPLTGVFIDSDCSVKHGIQWNFRYRQPIASPIRHRRPPPQ